MHSNCTPTLEKSSRRPRLGPRGHALLVIALFEVCLVSIVDSPAQAGRGGQLEVNVVDRDTGQPIACRMHLRNAADKAQKAPKTPFWHDHFVFDGHITLKLGTGTYNFEIERGPEYLNRTGHFTIEDFANDQQTIDLKRFTDMAKEGWWSGDLEVERAGKDLPLLMLADDLHVAEVVTWGSLKSPAAHQTVAKQPLVRFDGNRFYHLLAGADARTGGALLLLNLNEPLDLSAATAEFPPSLEVITDARQRGNVAVVAARAASWDLPVWVAAGVVDAVALADSRSARKTTKDEENGCRPRDKVLYPGVNGLGRWSEHVYYQLLNCGLRMAPAAASGSGIAPNPVGYNRMYVHVDDPMTYEKWIEGMRAGQVVVTNGPLIRPNVEGELPGHVFQAAAGQEIELEMGVTLSTRDPIAYLEVVKNGRMVHEVRLDEWAKAGGKLPTLKFHQSGWFVIRAVTEVAETRRFAATAPYYVEIGYQRRISKTAVQFFLDWLDERQPQLKLDNDGQRAAVLKHFDAARAFWQELAVKANAE